MTKCKVINCMCDSDVNGYCEDCWRGCQLCIAYNKRKAKEEKAKEKKK